MFRRICGGSAVVALTSLGLIASAAADCRGSGESAVICEVNVVRRAADRPALVAEPRLALAARRHARDMVRRGYFSHTTPAGRTMVDRLRAVGYLRG
jgi:uncharacterized protein YkwD